MGQNDLKLSPDGLWTAPSVIDAPAGGLLEAKEIVLRRKGMAEPRPGFTPGSGTGLSTNTWRLLEHELASGSQTLMSVESAHAYRVGTGSIIEKVRNTTTGATSDAELATWIRQQIWGVNVRGNVYLTMANGLRGVSSGDTSAISLASAYRAGVRTPHVWAAATATAGNVLVSDGSTALYVSYRALIRWTDENGLVKRSGVSGRHTVTSSGTGIQVEVHVTGDPGRQVFIPSNAAVEVYRTVASTVNPPVDEHFYVGECTLAGAESVAQGINGFTDNVADENLGTALYTNASEEGAEANHILPPTAGAAAVFNGSLFLGNVSYPPSQVLYVPYSSSSGTGVRVHSFNVTWTNGSTTATVADTSPLKVGMILLNSNGSKFNGPGFCVITAIVTNTSITFSQAWQGSSGAASSLAFDSIKIGTQYYPTGLGVSTLIASMRGCIVPGQAGGIYGTATLLAVLPPTAAPVDILCTTATADGVGVVGQANTSMLAEPGYVSLYGLTANQSSATSLTISATNGSLYQPPLPDIGSTPLTVSQLDQPNGLAWSNNMEPEHFQIPNTDQIAPNGRIMAMHALGNALLIFMDRGLWRVSGSGAESGFRFDQLDQDMRLIHPYAATRLKDMVYAHGDKGICACDENAAVPLTSLNLRDVLEPVQKAAGPGSTTAHGFFAVTNRKDEEVLFSVPAVGALTVGERLYVLNTVTGAWTNWLVSHSLACGIGKLAGPLEFVDTALGGSNVSLTERDVNTFPYTVDGTRGSLTGISASGQTISYATQAANASAGDLLYDGSTYYVALSVSGSSTQTVTLDRAWTGSTTADVYVGYTSTITPIASIAAAPGYLKNWGEGRIMFRDLAGVARFVLSVTSSTSATAVSQNRDVASSGRTGTTDTRPEAFRFVCPRNHCRATRLFPSLRLTNGGATWKYEGMDVGYQISSDRTVRKR